MSFRFRLPEEDPICECKYDEIHDRMDREDCPFHCDMEEDSEPAAALEADRKPPTSVGVAHRQRVASGVANRKTERTP
jgi:hypothetical protein